jgi:FtsH-binding integral membrane protein
MIDIKIDNKNKKKLEFSKRLAVTLIITSLVVTVATLYLSYLCIINNLDASLPFLVALVGLNEVTLGYVCGAYMNKSKAENTVGGIVHDTAMYNLDNKGEDCFEQ